MVELNPEATQAATGAFAERIGANQTTGDLMAALRFALEAYESVRVAPAHASQHDADISDQDIITIMFPHMLEADGGYACDIAPQHVVAGVREVLTSRAQRTDKPS